MCLIDHQQVVAGGLQARDGPMLRRITVMGAATQLATSSGGDLSEDSGHNHEDVGQVTVGHRGDEDHGGFSGQLSVSEEKLGG